MDDLNLLERLVLGGRIPTFVWPMPSCQDFDVEIQGKHLVARTLFEILHALFRHLDVLEHDFKTLGELETALFLKLFDHLLLSFFEDSS